MKMFSCIVALILLTAVCVFAGGASKGTGMTDANLKPTSTIGLDTAKTVTTTVTGTKVAFSDVTIISGTHQLQVNCVNAVTGAASAARLKVNNAGTEIPLNGLTPPFVVPSGVSSLAFTKYSTGTATDSVKCTAYGN
ncbi:MAG: hypothetical protein A2Y38_15915 [Spirochaetes bacterium GWB1_59_5]|nr:MAG: hypothetical protein A2Y38_15915 [Spirochaetes bacterium GWB1_59_5]